MGAARTMRIMRTLSDPTQPFPKRLTVAIVAGRMRERAQKVIDAVNAQTAAGQLELIIADTHAGAAAFRTSDELPTRILSFDAEATLGKIKSCLMRTATSPLVAFIEDHAMPWPTWAEAIIDSADQCPTGDRWAAGGYAFSNANPDSYFSRSGFIADYSEWAHPLPSSASASVARLPCNNVVYDRESALAFGDDLEHVMESDWNLCERLRQRGQRTIMIPKAITAHQNPESLLVLLEANRAHCRIIAAERARGERWGLWRRLVYGLAVPVGAPIKKFSWLTRAQMKRRTLWSDYFLAMPVVALVYFVAGLSEGAGYLFGFGKAPHRFRIAETDRARSKQFGRFDAKAR